MIAVLLGHRLADDGSISPVLRSRLDMAIVAQERFHPDRWILSGGIANPKAGVSEASKMRDYLVEKGFSESCLILEEQSQTTRENAIYAVRIAKTLSTDSLLLITSYRHLTRWYLNPLRLFAKEIGSSDLSLMTLTARPEFEIKPRR